MRHWITLVEHAATPITERYIAAAHAALNAADIPPEVSITLVDQHISGFADLPNMVEINNIEVAPELRGQGWASKSLKVLTDLADQFGVTLVLTVADYPDEAEDGRLSTEQLDAFYWRHGFQGERKMWRNPRPGPTASTAPRN